MSKVTYKGVWDTLSAINVNNHIEKKGNLSYLSWAWAWGELMKRYPETVYTFQEPKYFEDGTVMVYCYLNIGTLAREMFLPVMDHRNNSIKNPSTRQISDAQMRCLTKCIAMFGLGHYIYAGEDVPKVEDRGVVVPPSSLNGTPPRNGEVKAVKSSDEVDRIRSRPYPYKSSKTTLKTCSLKALEGFAKGSNIQRANLAKSELSFRSQNAAT